VYIFGLRLNLYIASVLAVIGAVWFYRSQRRPDRTCTARAALATETPEPAEPADDAGAARSGGSADAGADDSPPPDDAASGDPPQANAQPSRDSEQATS
jgi:hypothetical protein